MKYFVFVLSFAITTFLAAEEFPIMMQIKTNLSIPEDFRGGVEEGLTENGYSLVSEETQIQTIKEQANQRKKECYDESCLVDVGKMLAAKGLFLVEVTQKADKYYLFKVKYIDFETGTTQKIKQDYFKYDLSDFEELNKFGKSLIKGMFGKNETSKTKEVVKEVIIKDNSKTETSNKTKFKIEFTTTPSGVEVYDEKGNFLGETPFFVSLPKGFTKFSFEKKGFDKVLKEIHIKQDEKIEISMAEKIYNLKINTNISGATIFIDGKEKGETPYTAKLTEGIYSIKLEKEEYDSYSEELPLKKDVDKTITLNKNIFEIIITSNTEDTKVYIDGVLKGKTPYTTKLNKGKHTIKVTKDDFGNKEKEFEINKDETISFELYEKGKGIKYDKEMEYNNVINNTNEKNIDSSIKFGFGTKLGFSFAEPDTYFNNGIELGLLGIMHFNNIFIQSELNLLGYASDYYDSDGDNKVSFLTIPILLGYSFKIFQIYTGPEFSFLLNDKIRTFEIDYDEKKEIKFSSFDLNFSIGLCFYHFMYFEIRYSKNISNNFENHIDNRLLISFGWKFW